MIFYTFRMGTLLGGGGGGVVVVNSPMAILSRTLVNFLQVKTRRGGGMWGTGYLFIYY